MNATTVLVYLGLGLLLGAIGQSARVIVGLKKTSDDAQSSNLPLAALFNGRQLATSLLIGGVAGAFAVIPLLGEAITKESLMVLITAGYAGADFIEGFIRRQGPGVNPPPIPGHDSIAPVNPFNAPTPAKNP